MKKLLLSFLFCTSLANAQNIWTETPLQFSEYRMVDYVSIVDDDTVWVIGSLNFGVAQQDPNPEWGISTDGGLTWTTGHLNLLGSHPQVTSLHAINATTAYITVGKISISDTGSVWKTDDSGATWVKQTMPPAYYTFAYFWDDDHGIAIGSPYSINDDFTLMICTTENGGLTWQETPAASRPQEYIEYCFNPFVVQGDTIWFGTQNSIYRSNDRGLTWTPNTLFPVTNDKWIVSFAFTDADNGVLCANDENFKTADGGATWVSGTQNPSIESTGWVYSIPGSPNYYFLLGSYGAPTDVSFFSTDGCENWSDLNTIDPNPVIPSLVVKFRSGSVAYCNALVFDGQNYLIRFFRLTDPLNRFLKDDNFMSGNQFSLAPNPTSAELKISGIAITAVRICDVTGKEVLSENFNASTEVSLDVSALEKGIYLAKISDDSGNTSVSKIIKK